MIGRVIIYLYEIGVFKIYGISNFIIIYVNLYILEDPNRDFLLLFASDIRMFSFGYVFCLLPTVVLGILCFIFYGNF